MKGYDLLGRNVTVEKMVWRRRETVKGRVITRTSGWTTVRGPGVPFLVDQNETRRRINAARKDADVESSS